MINNLNDIYFFVRDDTILTQDVVGEACSLLLNADEETVIELKREFNKRSINMLFGKWFNRVTILKTTSFVLSDEGESQDRSKLFSNER